MHPRFEQVSKSIQAIDCYQVDMEAYPDIANIFDIESFPTFIFISKKGNLKKWTGEVPQEELVEMIHEAFSNE